MTALPPSVTPSENIFAVPVDIISLS